MITVDNKDVKTEYHEPRTIINPFTKEEEIASQDYTPTDYAHNPFADFKNAKEFWEYANKHLSGH